MIIPANSAVASGYAVDNSCRFNDGSSDNLAKTPSSASNRRTWTWSGWVKRSGLGNIQTLFDGSDGNYPEIFYFDANDKFLYHHDIVGSDYKLISSQVFRDVSAWYHIVVAKDTTQSTETNRLKVYVNGSQITMNESALGYPAQNFEGGININDLHIIGNWKGNSYYIDGYLAEIAFVDGSQLAADQFGEFDADSGIWKPIDVSGLTFGTNGFYLDFKDSANLGNDANGGTDWTENNLTAIDQTTDTPTNNFATMNPLDNIGATTFSEGNNLLLWTATNKTNKSTIGVTAGKWYAECKAIDVNGGTTGALIGVGTEANLASTYLSATTSGWGYRCQTGNIQNGAGNEAYGDTWVENDIIGVALDMDNGAVYMSKNGTFQDSGDPTSGASKTNAANNQPSYGSAISGTLFFACSSYDTDSLAWNFGNPPFSISSGNADADGYGNFEYAVPSGFYALCTKNVAEYG